MERRVDPAQEGFTEQKIGTEIYERYIQSENTEFEQTIRMHRYGLMRYLYRRVGSLEAAEELAEDCFVELFLHPGRYRGEGTLKNYLYAVARHKASSYLRRNSRASYVPIEVVAEMCLDDREAQCLSAERQFAAGERRRVVMRALSGLPEAYGMALYLLYFEGLSCETAAKAMGKTRKQMYNLTARAKAAMRGQLEKEGITGENGLGI